MEKVTEKVKESITSTKASKETNVRKNNASTLNASAASTNDKIAKANRKFMSFNEKPILRLLAGYHLTLTETSHSGNLYIFKADDESGLFSSKDFPMSIIVEVCPSCCVTLTVMNRKNSRVFINKRGFQVDKGFEWNALDRLIWGMSLCSHEKIEKLKTKEMK